MDSHGDPGIPWEENPNKVEVTLVLGRKVINEILLFIFKRISLMTFLLTYTPTTLLVSIVYLTSYFKPFYFEATLTVNLTGKILN